MPLITPPKFVSTYLHNHGYDKNPNLLIIAENYPEPTLSRYFYSPILPNFSNRGLPAFSKEIFKNFGVTGVDELNKLNNFLNGSGLDNGKRLLIDAFKDGIKPPLSISTSRFNKLLTDIIDINPNYILIMHRNNKDLVEKLIKSPRFNHLLSRLLKNPNHTIHPNIFPFLSAPANPDNFTNALEEVRKSGIPI